VEFKRRTPVGIRLAPVLLLATVLAAYTLSPDAPSLPRRISFLDVQAPSFLVMFDSSSQETREARLERVISYIDENIGDLDRARDIAEVVDVSYETLRKHFRREMGVPIGRYLRQKRIDEARRRLVETDEPVYVVCWKVGYSSDSSGIRAFRQVTGMTMEEYQETVD